MSATTNDYDVVIIGAGHNGLTCAGYLARAGYSVKVVERRHVIGGAAVTEEFHPGFRNSSFSYTVSLLNPKIIRELELNKYGLNITTRDYSAFAISDNDICLHSNSDLAYSNENMRKLCATDPERYHELEKVLNEVADVMRDVVLETPPNIGGGLMDLFRAGKLANRIRKLSPRMQRETIKLFTMSVADYLKEWISGDLLNTAMSYIALVGNMQSAHSQGSAYVLLHHMFGEVNGIKGAWGHAQGGMGAITQSMAKSAQAHGADIEVSAPVKNVLIENGVARGVVLEDGRTIRARVVAANTNPKLLFTKLVDQKELTADFANQINHYRCRSGSFRMNVALSEIPDFTCTRGDADREKFLRGSILIAPSMKYTEEAYNDAEKFGWSKQPIVEMFIPSIYDNSLAPEGKHVASLFCQHFNPELPNGQSWDDVKEQVADLIIDTVTKYAPNFKSSILGRAVNSPLDLERTLGLIGGDIFHGCLHIDQVFAMRPVAGYADYRMPIRNLFLCGSGAHPGGGVSGCPGHNAAREIINDIKKNKIAV
jgi:phytoene dehydrogenase-like protein